MQVLAIDSAMNGCQAGVYEINEESQDVCVLAQDKLEVTRGQAEHLMPMIERVMKKSGRVYSDIDLIGVTNGPGAFTGMRIAIATAKAVALAADKPVVGVSTISAVLDSFLSQQTPEEPIFPYCAVILETKRKDYYFQLFELGADIKHASMEAVIEAEPARVASAFEIFSIISKKEAVLIGDAVERLMSECDGARLNQIITMPRGDSIAKLAVSAYKTKGGEYGCKPHYLREPEIGKAKVRPRVLKE